jgi:nicotinate-nucleotide adenylyltransferase
MPVEATQSQGRPARRKRIGVLGGTFDPIHYGHLFSTEVAAAGACLDQVLLVPASQSPLKPGAAAAAHHRVAMARLAAAGNPLLWVDTIDVDRPPPSYTVDTVSLLQERYPDADLFLILGADALQDFMEWREPERLLDLCRLIVVARPGYRLEVPAPVVAALGPRVQRIQLQPMPLLEISSTDLRRRFGAGEPVRYLLPDAVEEYVRAHGLYGAAPRRPGACR